MRLWLTTADDLIYLAALSMAHVVAGLGEFGDPPTPPFPEGAVGGRVVVGFPELHHLVRRAFQLSRTLPDALLRRFEHDTADLPRTTEAERLVDQRVRQDVRLGEQIADVNQQGEQPAQHAGEDGSEHDAGDEPEDPVQSQTRQGARSRGARLPLPCL